MQLQVPLFGRIFRQRPMNGVGMRRRLILYFISLLIILLSAVFAFLAAAGLFWSVESETEALLNAYLNEYSARVQSHIDGVAAQSVRLSQNLSVLIDQVLAEQGVAFSSLNDKPQSIADLENAAYGIAEQSLYMAAASGVFFVLDVSANTGIPGAEKSKSGLHIKIDSVNNPNTINPPLYLFRGAADIARLRDIIHHNNWKLEFHTDDYPIFERVSVSAGHDLMHNWYVSPVIDLPLTWDDAAFVAVPMFGADGVFYGVCGFEISKVYFMHAHTLSASEFSNIVGVLALREGDLLRSDTGLESGVFGRQSISVSNSVLTVTPRGALTAYADAIDRFVGVGRTIALSPLDSDDKWEIAVMVSASEYNAKSRNQNMLMLLLLVLVVAVSVLASLLLSIRFVQPITEGLAMIKEGGKTRSRLPEINDLLDFLAEQDEERDRSGRSAEEASPLIASYKDFMRRLDALTTAEREIFDLYLRGLTAQQIAEARVVSISTVRFHNRNIYAKLGVASRDELMLIARLIQGQERTSGKD